jgi:hypothetical protein
MFGGGLRVSELVSQFVGDHGLALLCCGLSVALIGGLCFARARRWRRRERLAREVEDALVQNAQSVILSVHGIVRHLAPEDPLRQKVEQALDRADAQLSEDRDRVQDLRAGSALDDKSHD